MLTYLGFHCKRYRDAKLGRFSPPKPKPDEKRHRKKHDHHDNHGTLNLPLHQATFKRSSPANSSHNVAASGSNGSSLRVDVVSDKNAKKINNKATPQKRKERRYDEELLIDSGEEKSVKAVNEAPTEVIVKAKTLKDGHLRR